jgi:hypothetical protein
MDTTQCLLNLFSNYCQEYNLIWRKNSLFEHTEIVQDDNDERKKKQICILQLYHTVHTLLIEAEAEAEAESESESE